MLRVIKLKLKELLKKKGLDKKPLRELADLMQIDHVSLWKMINGKPYNPSLAYLDRLCKALDCEPNKILQYNKEK
jgi:DNA-binding Xre family transcriptional regulator